MYPRYRAQSRSAVARQSPQRRHLMRWQERGTEPPTAAWPVTRGTR